MFPKLRITSRAQLSTTLLGIADRTIDAGVSS
jgi:hypothetical protein